MRRRRLLLLPLPRLLLAAAAASLLLLLGGAGVRADDELSPGYWVDDEKAKCLDGSPPGKQACWLWVSYVGNWGGSGVCPPTWASPKPTPIFPRTHTPHPYPRPPQYTTSGLARGRGRASGTSTTRAAAGAPTRRSAMTGALYGCVWAESREGEDMCVCMHVCKSDSRRFWPSRPRPV